MRQPQHLDSNDFSSLVQIYNEETFYHDEAPEATAKNIQVLVDSHNNLIDNYNNLLDVVNQLVNNQENGDISFSNDPYFED